MSYPRYVKPAFFALDVTEQRASDDDAFEPAIDYDTGGRQCRIPPAGVLIAAPGNPWTLNAFVDERFAEIPAYDVRDERGGLSAGRVHDAPGFFQRRIVAARVEQRRPSIERTIPFGARHGRNSAPTPGRIYERIL